MGGSTSLPDRHGAEVRDSTDVNVDRRTIAAPDRRLVEPPSWCSQTHIEATGTGYG